VEDVDAPLGLENAVDKAVAEIEESHGFLVRHHRVDLVGICAKCASIK
jgi:Fe2+ or Zn2+ uptake regulation protein